MLFPALVQLSKALAEDSPPLRPEREGGPRGREGGREGPEGESLCEAGRERKRER